MAMSSAFQFSCVALLVVHLAAGVPVTECQTAECGSSLLMHTAQIKGANLSLAEDSLQPAQGVSRAQTLLGSMQSLAEKVVSGEEKISNVTRQVLGSIETEMETVINDTKITFGEDQAEVGAAKTAIAACGTKATTDHTSANGVNSLQQNVVTKRAGHKACRALEKLNLTDKITSCNAFQTYASALSPPACTSAFPPGPSAATLTCIQAMATWSETANDTYLPKKNLCDGATTVHSATKGQCDTQQGNFESAFCTYATILTKTCEDQVSCRSSAIKARNAAHARVAIAEAGRKSEYKAAKNVICLLTVLAADAADMPGLLVGCEALTVDTSILNVNYPAIPDPAACDTSPVATRPCDAGWLQTEYSSQTGWYGFTQYNTLTSADETVAPQTCTACVAVVTTTTTTSQSGGGSGGGGGLFDRNQELGHLVCWGGSNIGLYPKDNPTPFQPLLKDVAVAGYCAIGIDVDGGLVFGGETCGDVGVQNGRGVESNRPDGLESGVQAISGGTVGGAQAPGNFRWAAIDSDGALVPWKSPMGFDIPEDLKEKLSSGVKAIDVSQTYGGYLLVIDRDGGVHCISGGFSKGEGVCNQLPEGLTSGAKAITAGEHNACVVDSEGVVKCWPGNSGAENPPEGLRATAVSCGSYQCCAINTDGGVQCWGEHSWAIYQKSTTVPTDLATPVKFIESNELRVNAVDANGLLRSWGRRYGDSVDEDRNGVVAIHSTGSGTCIIQNEAGFQANPVRR